MNDVINLSGFDEQNLKHPAPSKTPVISQDMLRRYLELQPLVYEFNGLRRKLRAALAAGASVEPGDLNTFLEVWAAHRLTHDYLFAKLGLTERQVADLRKTCPTIKQHILRVVEEL